MYNLTETNSCMGIRGESQIRDNLGSRYSMPTIRALLLADPNARFHLIPNRLGVRPNPA